MPAAVPQAGAGQSGHPHQPPLAAFLTDLSTRRASSPAQALAVIVIRLDRFAHASDTLGPIRSARIRDHVLARVATVLPPQAALHWLSETDLAVASPFPAGTTEPARVGAALANVLARPYQLDGYELSLSHSIGVSEDSPGMAAERALQQTFDAMLQVCRRGGNGVASTTAAATPRLAPLLAALPQAILRGELALHLQPRAAFASGTITGYTSRLRWRSATLGQVAPHDFVPGLEALGMMGNIARWLLRTMLPLMRAPGISPDLQLTLLAPSAQLHCTQMLDMLRQAIDAFGILPGRLCIEIPVAALPDDNDIASQFDQLRRRGVRLALSDFSDNPAGRSALEWLAPDVVTLDARQLGQPAHPDLGRTLREACAYAQAAGASVCAKGIETREQMVQVRDWGCDSMQGYLLSQSFPARWLPETHPALAQRARELLA